MQGYQDRHGTPKPNAHLLGLFTRICKLLYYKIKPVFVFDGGVPMLKKNTIVNTMIIFFLINKDLFFLYCAFNAKKI